MFNNLSSRLLIYVFITVSLSLILNVNLGLNFSYQIGFSAFLKYHISQSFHPYSSNSVLNFALSILLTARTNLRPLDKREISATERFLLKRLIALLPTDLPSNFSPLCVATFLSYYHCHVFLQTILISLRKTTSSKNTATVIHNKNDVKILKVWKFRLTKCLKLINEFEKQKVLIISLKNHFLE